MMTRDVLTSDRPLAGPALAMAAPPGVFLTPVALAPAQYEGVHRPDTRSAAIAVAARWETPWGNISKLSSALLAGG